MTGAMTPERLDAAARCADLPALRAIAADRGRPTAERNRARRLAVRFARARRGFAPDAAPRRTEAQMAADSAPTAPEEPIPGSGEWTCAHCGAVSGPFDSRCSCCRRHPDEWRCRCGWTNDPTLWRCARRGCGADR